MCDTITRLLQYRSQEVRVRTGQSTFSFSITKTIASLVMICHHWITVLTWLEASFCGQSAVAIPRLLPVLKAYFQTCPTITHHVIKTLTGLAVVYVVGAVENSFDNDVSSNSSIACVQIVQHQNGHWRTLRNAVPRKSDTDSEATSECPIGRWWC